MPYSTNGSGFWFLQSAYLNVLEERGIVRPETALPLHEIDGMINPFVRFGAFGSGWLVVHELSRYSVLVACPGGRYYLNQEATDEFRHRLARWLTW
jgi:hypothetical protein